MSILKFFVSLNLVVCACYSFAASKYWTGATDSSASKAANWCDDAELTTISTAAPAAGDDIYLTSGSAAMKWNLSISVGSWTQDGYTGTVTFSTGKKNGTSATLYGYTSDNGETRSLKVTGNVVFNTGNWSVEAQPTMGSSTAAIKQGYGVYRIIADIDGDFTMGASAKVNLLGKGFAALSGPGYTGNNDGASHGGSGGLFKSSKPKSCYGVVASPITLGSGGKSSAGGGAFTLTCDGAATINGTINVMGAEASYHTGAGGSIFITASSIAGTGTLNANGGNCTHANYRSAGGGGRIAIILTGENSDFSNFSSAVVKAKLNKKCTTHGTGDGSGGTIYMEKPSDGKSCGILTIDGSEDGINSETSVLSSYYCKTEITSSILNCTPSKIIFKKTGRAILNISGQYVLPEIVQESDSSISGEGYLEIGPSTTVVLPNGMVDVPLSIYQAGGNILLGENCEGVLEIGSGQKLYVNNTLTIDGTIIIRSGGTLSHRPFSSSKMNLTITGDLIVDKGGLITASGRGNLSVGTTGNYGGCYGGKGASAQSRCYGSVRYPVDYGSSGDGTGSGHAGGAIRITSLGDMAINGSVRSDGGNVNYRPGSGGSVYLTANSISGNGAISANGGAQIHSTAVSAGGGGRIAVHLTGAGNDFSQFTGKISAYGGTRTDKKVYGGAGTIYLKTGDEMADEGTLLIANSNRTDTATDIMTGGDYQSRNVTDLQVGEVVVDGAFLNFDNAEITSKRGFTLKSTSKLTSTTTSRLVLDGTCDAYMRGANKFSSFKCETPGKTIYFGTNAKDSLEILNSGNLVLKGDKDQKLKLLPEIEDASWLLKVPVASLTSFDVAQVLVGNSDASTGEEIVAQNSEESPNGSCVNWKFVNISEGETITWLGQNSDWNDAQNWDLGRIPTISDNVVIPLTSNNPQLESEQYFSELQISSGASLDLAGNNITVSNTCNIAGSLTYSGKEIVTCYATNILVSASTLAKQGQFVIAGDLNQEVQFNGEVNKLFVNKAGGTITWAGIATARMLYSISATAQTQINYQAGSKITADEFRANGIVGSLQALTLDGLQLNVSKYASAKGVRVIGSSSTTGAKIYVDTPFEDLGGNTGWLFGSAKVVWTGAVDSVFDNPENWSGGVAPGESDIVEISSAATITISHETTISGLVLSGGEESVKLTVRGALNVKGDLYIGKNATLTLDVPSKVSGDVLIAEGGVLTHTSGQTAESYKINLTVGGDMAIAEGGAINVKAKGYAASKGPAHGVEITCGASYGGRGDPNGSETVPCYGSYLEPINYGSGGQGTGGSGGGAIRLIVQGVLLVDGTINADAQSMRTIYTGSGGSVYLTCGDIVGYGTITAHGGTGYYSALSGGFLGGGGRISIEKQGEGGFDNWHGSVLTYGGWYVVDSGMTYYPQGSSGTIAWRELGAKPKIILDNKTGNAVDSCTGCDLPAANGDSKRKMKEFDIVLKNAGKLYLTSDVTIWDLSMDSSSAVLYLNGHTLTIISNKHRDRKGWNGSVRGSGSIVWKPVAFSLVIR